MRRPTFDAEDQRLTNQTLSPKRMQCARVAQLRQNQGATKCRKLLFGPTKGLGAGPESEALAAFVLIEISDFVPVVNLFVMVRDNLLRLLSRSK